MSRGGKRSGAGRKAKATAETPTGILRNRVVERKRLLGSELLPNEKNWRQHPEAQTEALRGILTEIGMAGELLAYYSERNGGKLTTIDGHLRSKEFAGELWDVAITDLDDAEADKLLAAHDPLAALATADAAKLDALLAGVKSDSAAVQQMLAELAAMPPMTFTEPPPAVQQNMEELESIKAQRAKGKENVISKTDTERYIVLVYADREAKNAALAKLGLPEDERYIAAEQVKLESRGIVRTSGPQAAPSQKAGATG